uniref:Uncharacterized protein n=1 Tax=Anguilla anguilla TaxID=7936 RepID=A0A0E9RSD6_ANGAN
MQCPIYSIFIYITISIILT